MIPIMRLLLLPAIGLLALLSACAPAGHDFCIANGHEEDSTSYKQCTLNYGANEDLYKYCQDRMGITQEGPQLGQCLQQARQLKDMFSQERNFCQGQANNRYGAVLSQGRKEKQPTLHPDGVVTLDDVSTPGMYSLEDQIFITKPYVDPCMQAHGWGHPDIWQNGKQSVPLPSITQTLTALNTQPLTVVLPVHPISNLFQAVSNGNQQAVRDLTSSFGGIDVNSQNYQGYTALHVAARQGNFSMVQMLVESLHANIDIRSARGENAMSMAAQSPNRDIVTYLTQYVQHQEAEHLRREDERRRKEDERRRQKELDRIRNSVKR